jgi:glyoxylase-like metal-dependent hydrolase (beta-lactamase superfamily II)
MAVLVQSDGEQFWIAGDMAIHPVDVPNPTFAGLPDVEPDRMLATRERLFARMAEEGGLVSFFHFDPFPSLGRVVVEDDAWRWEPVADDAATPAT